MSNGQNTNATRRSKTPAEKLTEEEIKQCLKEAGAGYPFEIRLLRAFQMGGMDPEIGFRIPTESGKTTEIDIMAHYTESIPSQFYGQDTVDSFALRITMRALIQAKSFPLGEALIGFPWERPSDHELRVARLRFGGSPSWNVLPRQNEQMDFLFEKEGIAEALDPLNTPPVCVQWAIIKRTKPGNEQRVVADHEQNVWDDMDSIIKTAERLTKDTSQYTDSTRDPFILFHYPTLILATEKLYLYDAIKEELTTTDRLILQRHFEIEGQVVHRIIDVVTEAAVPKMITAYRQAIDTMKTRTQQHASSLYDVGLAQRIWLKQKRKDKQEPNKLEFFNPFDV